MAVGESEGRSATRARRAEVRSERQRRRRKPTCSRLLRMWSVVEFVSVTARVRGESKRLTADELNRLQLRIIRRLHKCNSVSSALATYSLTRTHHSEQMLNVLFMRQLILLRRKRPSSLPRLLVLSHLSPHLLLARLNGEGTEWRRWRESRGRGGGDRIVAHGGEGDGGNGVGGSGREGGGGRERARVEEGGGLERRGSLMAHRRSGSDRREIESSHPRRCAVASCASAQGGIGGGGA